MIKKKQLFFVVLLTLLFFCGIVFYIHKKNPRIEVQLVIQAKTAHEDTWEFYLDEENPLDIHVTSNRNFSTYTIRLPKKEIKRIRFVPGQRKGLVVFKDIKLLSLFSEQKWESTFLKTIFIREKGIRKIFLKNDSLYVKTLGKNSFIELDKAACQQINKMSGNKTAFYISAVVLSLLFFYFARFFNPGGFLIFFKPGIFANMIFLFLLIIFLPLTDNIFHFSRQIKANPARENRALAEKPAFRFKTLLNYLRAYQPYYNDRFCFRNVLIYTNSIISIKLFGISPVPSVLVGKNRWLFLAQEEKNLNELDYYRAVKPFTEEELEQWRIILELRRTWLRARGSFYLFVVAPNKSTIYREFMPGFLHPVLRQTRLDQLIDYLRKDPDFPILDLRQPLFAAKKERPVYLKTDSHWNDYGAYIVYREILRYFSRFNKELQPLPLSGFNIIEEDNCGGDLAVMMYLQEKYFRERHIRLRPQKPFRAKWTTERRLSVNISEFIKECSTCTLPPLVMVHDSFGESLKPFIAEHFSRVIYIHDWNLNFYPEIIKKEKAGIVIDEMAERFLLNKFPGKTPL